MARPRQDQEKLDLTDTLTLHLLESERSESRKKFLAKARKYTKIFRQESWWLPGDDWQEYMSERPTSTENVIMPTVETLVSVLLKNRPIIMMEPYKPSDYDLSDSMNRHMDSSMDTARLIPNMRIGSKATFITGMNLYHDGWDRSYQTVHEDGDFKFQSISPVDYFLDPKPGITDIQQSRVLAIRHWVPEGVLVERFGQPVLEALGLEKRRGRPRNATGSRMAGMAADQARNLNELGLGNVEDDEWQDMLRSLFDAHGDLWPVYEFWYKDNMYEAEQLGTGNIRYKRKDAFGKRVFMVNQHIIDGPVPNPNRKYRRVPMMIDGEYTGEVRTVPIGHGEFPVTRQVAYQVWDDNLRTGLYDVMGVVEQLETLQFDINQLSRQQILNAISTANNNVIMDPEAFVNAPTTWGRSPGEVLFIDKKGSQGKSIDQIFRDVPGQPLSAGVHALYAEKKQSVPQISGVRPFISGDFTGMGTSHTTTGGMSAMAEASASPLWSLIHNLEDAMVSIGKHNLGNMQLFYKPGRMTSVEIDGQMVWTEWESRHASAEFKMKVASGTSTILQDVDRVRNLAFVQQIVVPALQARDPELIRFAIMTLQNAKLPWTHEFIQRLRKLVVEIEQQQREQEQAAGLMSAGMLAGAQPQGQGSGLENVEMLARQLGVSPRDLIAA